MGFNSMSVWRCPSRRGHAGMAACRWGGLVGVLALATAQCALAGTLTLKIRAINPSQTDRRPAEVKAFLPKPAGPETIVSAGELEVFYDVATKGYYVHKKVDLDPGQTRTFEVVLNDIWVITEQDMTALGNHARALAEATKGTAQDGTAAKVAAVIDESLKAVSERQRAYAIGVAKPVDHIRAHETNVQALEQVRRDIGALENLVLAAGKDPGQIMGSPRVKPPAEPDIPAGTGRTVVVRIKVSNPSLTEKKAPPLRRELPAEIKPTDILDAGGLQVGFDAGKGVSYVYAEAVELPPQQSREFEVKVRDPWGGLVERLASARTQAAALATLARETEAYKSVIADAERLVKDCDALATNKPPETMNEEYVAFARRQMEMVRDLEGRVIRLEELFQPRQKPHPEFGAKVLNVKPPSRETTWRIIWIILGFLAAFSVLFFLRWYGRSKSELLAHGTPAPGGEGRPPDAGAAGQGSTGS